MREFKFRAWDNNIKKMIIQEYSDRLDKILHYWETHIKTSIMQYVGKNDKNGVEIYENDIVKVNDEIFIVLWSDYHSSFQVHYYLDRPSRTSLYEIGCGEEIEVIGNTYENPELMKVEL